MIATEPIEKSPVHLGRNVQRSREILGMKQLTLADITGMSQQNISKLEQSEFIVDETLEKLAKGLGVTKEFIKSFNEQKTILNFQSNNTYSDTAVNNSSSHYQPTIYNNPYDKIAEQFEEINRLNAALLQAKDEKIALLERFLEKK